MIDKTLIKSKPKGIKPVNDINQEYQDAIDALGLKFDVETEKELKNDKAWPEDKR